MDPLSEILALIRLKGVVYFRRDFAAPWGLDMGAGDFALFHLIVRGQCFVELPGLEGRPVALSSGDIVMFPHGARHALFDHPASGKMAGSAFMEAHSRGAPVFAGPEPATTMVCGHFEFDRGLAHQLVRDLPGWIHLKRSDPRELSWLETVTAAIIQEADSGKPGADAVVGRLAELLFVQLLRIHIGQNDPPRGWLAALSDERVGKAIRFLHNRADERLSLAQVARAVGMSRSSLAARFKDLVGMTPMGYLTEWRLLRARDLLQSSAHSIEQICGQVGYMSEAAFNRAFKRKFGHTPGAVRRAARA